MLSPSTNQPVHEDAVSLRSFGRLADRPATAPRSAGAPGAIRWVGFTMWVVAAGIVVSIATLAVLLGLYLLDIAAAGAEAGRGAYDCLDEGCVGQSWLVGLGLIVGAVTVVGGVVPAFLSSRPTLRLATGLAWLMSIGLSLWAVATAFVDADSAVLLCPLPAACTAILALGCHLRLRSRAGRLAALR